MKTVVTIVVVAMLALAAILYKKAVDDMKQVLCDEETPLFI